MATNKEVADILTRVRTALIIDQPFYGMLALRLKFVEDAGTKTMAVDGVHIFYNPDFVKSLPINQVKTVVAHEVMHCVFAHISRRGDRNPRKFNQAGDHVINIGLKDSKFEPVPSWLCNEGFRNMTTDHVYSLLPDDDNDPKSDPMDECMDSADGTAEGDMVEVEWKIATVQAAKMAKDEGKLPGSVERFVDELTSVKVDWRAVLRRFIVEVSKNDYSWSRFNRRFQSQGIFLPSLYSESMGELVTTIDTSGSVDQPTLNAFGTEIKAIVDGTRPTKTYVIYCDSKVQHMDEYGPNDELAFKMHGGGGTAFYPAMVHVSENNIRPACMVYLTDGFGPFPDVPPEYPVLWCMTSNVVAPFGETVRIEI